LAVKLGSFPGVCGIYGISSGFDLTLTCTDCGKTWTVSEEAGAAGIEQGDVVKKLHQGLGLFGPVAYDVNIAVCEDCQRIARAAARKLQPRLSVELEMVAIRQITAELLETNPELSQAERIHLAVEKVNAINREPNLAFRKWLLDHDR
jgi:hypothetical protein